MNTEHVQQYSTVEFECLKQFKMMSSSFKSAFQDFYKDEYQLFFDKYSQSDAGQSDIVLIYSMDDLPDFKYTKYYLRYNYSFAEKFVIRNR